MKKIKMENTIDGRLPTYGYAVYDIDLFSNKLYYCRWWVFPLFMLAKKLKRLKYYIYHKLNTRGVMKTPEGCVMVITDIPFIAKMRRVLYDCKRVNKDSSGIRSRKRYSG